MILIFQYPSKGINCDYIKSHIIYVSSGNEERVINVTTNATSAVITGLLPGVTYTIKVAFVNNAGLKSDVQSCQTVTAPCKFHNQQQLTSFYNNL